jgi:hypothetical protein
VQASEGKTNENAGLIAAGEQSKSRGGQDKAEEHDSTEPGSQRKNLKKSKEAGHLEFNG